MFKYVCLAAIIGTAHMLMGLHFEDRSILIPGMIMMLVAMAFWAFGIRRAIADQVQRMRYGHDHNRQYGD